MIRFRHLDTIRVGRYPMTLRRLALAGLWLAAGTVRAATNSAGQIAIGSAAAGDTNFRMRIVELERGPKTSLLRVTHEKTGSSVGSSAFILSAFHEIAKARGGACFANRKEWEDAAGARFYVGGFTDNQNADIQDEFGAEFTDGNESGQKRRLGGAEDAGSSSNGKFRGSLAARRRRIRAASEGKNSRRPKPPGIQVRTANRPIGWLPFRGRGAGSGR